MIKLIASDLDGTLLNRFHTTDNYILSTIDKAIANNIHFVIATGRSMQMDDFALNFNDRPLYLICNNGALIKNEKKEIIYKKSLPIEFIKETLKRFPNTPIDFIGASKTWVNASKESYLVTFDTEKKKSNKHFLKIINHFQKGRIYDCHPSFILNQEILKMNVRILDSQQKTDFKKHLDNFPSVANLPFADGIFEITHSDVNKAAALRIVCDNLQIDYSEVAVFGDGGNDIEMLSEFHHSYAPKNANPKTKVAAKYIIGHSHFYSVPLQIRKIIRNTKKKRSTE